MKYDYKLEDSAEILTIAYSNSTLMHSGWSLADGFVFVLFWKDYAALISTKDGASSEIYYPEIMENSETSLTLGNINLITYGFGDEGATSGKTLFARKGHQKHMVKLIQQYFSIVNLQPKEMEAKKSISNVLFSDHFQNILNSNMLVRPKLFGLF